MFAKGLSNGGTLRHVAMAAVATVSIGAVMMATAEPAQAFRGGFGGGGIFHGGGFFGGFRGGYGGFGRGRFGYGGPFGYGYGRRF